MGRQARCVSASWGHSRTKLPRTKQLAQPSSSGKSGAENPRFRLITTSGPGRSVEADRRLRLPSWGGRLNLPIYRIPPTGSAPTTCGLGWSTIRGRNRPTGSRKAGNREGETQPDAESAPPGSRRVSLRRGRDPAGTGSCVTLCDVATNTSPDPGRTGASADFSWARF